MKKHEGTGFNDFCRVTREVMDIVAQHSAAFALKAHGYCFDFAVRKFVIAESFHRYRGMTLATSQGSADPVEWEAVSIIEIRSVTADSGEHLCIYMNQTLLLPRQARPCLVVRTGLICSRASLVCGTRLR